jgi:hypothetical protein
MTIIDLRPLDGKKIAKDLDDIIIDSYKTIRGATKIIYEVPDEIWVTPNQKPYYGDTITFNNGSKAKVVVKNAERVYPLLDELTS